MHACWALQAMAQLTNNKQLLSCAHASVCDWQELYMHVADDWAAGSQSSGQFCLFSPASQLWLRQVDGVPHGLPVLPPQSAAQLLDVSPLSQVPLPQTGLEVPPPMPHDSAIAPQLVAMQLWHSALFALEAHELRHLLTPHSEKSAEQLAQPAEIPADVCKHAEIHVFCAAGVL